MKGKILDYNIQKSSGVISGDDENRYSFISSEWRSDKSPEVNQIVDFEIDGKEAKGIYLETNTIHTKTNDSTWMAITSLFLGMISFLAVLDDSTWDKDTIVGLFLFASGGILLGTLTIHNKLKGKNMAIVGILLSALALLSYIGRTG